MRGPGRPGHRLADRLRRHRRRLGRAAPALRPPQPERRPRARELDLREHRDLRLEGAAAAHRAAVGGDGLGDVRQQVHLPRASERVAAQPNGGVAAVPDPEPVGRERPLGGADGRCCARELAALAPDVDRRCRRCATCPGGCRTRRRRWRPRCGWHHVFAPSTAWGGGHEGLAIVSRFPIGAHERRPLPHSTENEGRIVLSARLDGDAGGALGAHDPPQLPRERGAQARGPGAVHRRGRRRRTPTTTSRW